MPVPCGAFGEVDAQHPGDREDPLGMVVVTADGCESLSLKWTGSPEDPAVV
jgi:hypothetical protein